AHPEAEEEEDQVGQGELNVASYYQKLVDLWEELEAMEVLPCCTHGVGCVCYGYIVAKHHKRKIIQFLMGLNDSFLPLRTHILATTPMPSLNVIYAMVVQDEIQKNLSKLPYVETSAMYVQNQERDFNNCQGKNEQQYKPSTNSNAGKNKRNLVCTYCQMQGHLRESCFKLNGYPPWHRLYKGNTKQNQATKGSNNNSQRYLQKGIIQHHS
uniref:Uncharacterized protein n=1 Tax=Kalanchoe fedtschenkoi TaxID=63787 RepID=A0A7N0U7E9_KALFE